MVARKLFLSFLLLIGVSCSKSPQPSSEKPTKPVLLVSIAPYRFLTEQIAGPDFQVLTAVPPGSDPHSFEPTSQQMQQLLAGQVWFRIGEPFEEKAVSLLKQTRANLVVQDLREGIALIPEASSSPCPHCSHDHFDRHIWLSPRLAAIQAETIANVLSETFPDHGALFESNLQKLKATLTALDQEIEALLKPVEGRALLVSHPSFGYFCQDYDLLQLSIEYEGKDPRPKHLERILQEAKAHHAAIAFAQPQYNNKGAQLIAEKMHLPIRLIDPYGADYVETLRKLAQWIADPYAPQK